MSRWQSWFRLQSVRRLSRASRELSDLLVTAEVVVVTVVVVSVKKMEDTGEYVYATGAGLNGPPGGNLNETVTGDPDWRAVFGTG